MDVPDSVWKQPNNRLQRTVTDKVPGTRVGTPPLKRELERCAAGNPAIALRLQFTRPRAGSLSSSRWAASRRTMSFILSEQRDAETIGAAFEQYRAYLNSNPESFPRALMHSLHPSGISIHATTVVHTMPGLKASRLLFVGRVANHWPKATAGLVCAGANADERTRFARALGLLEFPGGVAQLWSIKPLTVSLIDGGHHE